MSEEREKPGYVARRWWTAMQRRDDDGDRNRNADPGALARLRRAATPLDAARVSQTMVLYRSLYPDKAYSHNRLERVAVAASVLAHVREGLGAGRPTGRLLGPIDSEKPETAVMSAGRFSRLVAARNAAETLRAFREAVTLLGGAAPVADLADALLHWTHPTAGERIKTRWLFDYHDAPAPFAANPETPAETGPENRS